MRHTRRALCALASQVLFLVCEVLHMLNQSVKFFMFIGGLEWHGCQVVKRGVLLLRSSVANPPAHFPC